MKFRNKSESSDIKHGINYYFLAALFAMVIIYQFGNGQAPEDDNDLDIYEASLLTVHAVATTIAFLIAKRFWGGENVFGKAYLALAIGMLGNFIGWAGWFYFEAHGVENPYPYWNDLGFVIWHVGALLHMRLTTKRFKKKIGAKNWFVLLIIPSVIALFYLIGYGGGINYDENGLMFSSHLYYDFDDPETECDRLCFVTSIFFIFVNPLMFSAAVVGYSVFRKGILGPAWMLLIIGIALTVLADVPYYYLELYGIYERSHWYTMFYFASPLIMAYALYRHKDL